MAENTISFEPFEDEQDADAPEIMLAIRALEAESVGFGSGDLADERAESLRRYLCEPYGNEIDGRSQVVSTDLRDVVEWIVPQWLKVILSGDQIVEFSPVGPQDEEQAKQESAYVNHVILQKNDAFVIMSTWARDALISKNGYVKAYPDERRDIKVETYKGLTEDAYTLLLNDKDVEIVEESIYAGPDGGTLRDVRARRVYTCVNIKIDNVPPEEIRVHKSVKGVNLQEAIFVQHRRQCTLSEVRMMGYDVADDDPRGEPHQDNDSTVDARDRYEEETELLEGYGATKMVWLSDSYVRFDEDGDGVAELRRVVHIDSLILANEEADLIPFACITPIVFPHRHVGLGYDDLVEQQGAVKTALMRGALDNLYQQINGRFVADDARTNIDDLLVSRPNGVIRVKGDPTTAVMQLAQPNTFPVALQGMEWADAWRENSTGVSAYYQGMNADALNKTAHGVAQIMSASQQRVEAVIRGFANGLRDLCYIVHALTLKNATSDEKVRLREQWVTVDPRTWVKRTDLVVTVGLGSGTRETRIQQLMMLWQLQFAGLQAGIATPVNLYETGRKISEEMGYRNAATYWTDPRTQPPAPPQPPVDLIKVQADVQKNSENNATQLQIAAMNNETKEDIAALQAAVQRLSAEITVAAKRESESFAADREDQRFARDSEQKQQEQQQQKEGADLQGSISELIEAAGALRELLAKPRQVVRGEDGRIAGLQ